MPSLDCVCPRRAYLGSTSRHFIKQVDSQRLSNPSFFITHSGASTDNANQSCWLDLAHVVIITMFIIYAIMPISLIRVPRGVRARPCVCSSLTLCILVSTSKQCLSTIDGRKVSKGR